MLVRITPASCCYARSAAIQSRCNAASPVFEHIEAVSRRNLALRVVRTAGDQATSKSLYDLLGIEGTADRSEIKKAFRSLVSKLHPDLSTEPDEQGRFEVELPARSGCTSPVYSTFLAAYTFICT